MAKKGGGLKKQKGMKKGGKAAGKPKGFAAKAVPRNKDTPAARTGGRGKKHQNRSTKGVKTVPKLSGKKADRINRAPTKKELKDEITWKGCDYDVLIGGTTQQGTTGKEKRLNCNKVYAAGSEASSKVTTIQAMGKEVLLPSSFFLPSALAAGKISLKDGDVHKRTTEEEEEQTPDEAGESSPSESDHPSDFPDEDHDEDGKKMELDEDHESAVAAGAADEYPADAGKNMEMLIKKISPGPAACFPSVPAEDVEGVEAVGEDVVAGKKLAGRELREAIKRRRELRAAVAAGAFSSGSASKSSPKAEAEGDGNRSNSGAGATASIAQASKAAGGTKKAAEKTGRKAKATQLAGGVDGRNESATSSIQVEVGGEAKRKSAEERLAERAIETKPKFGEQAQQPPRLAAALSKQMDRLKLKANKGTLAMANKNARTKKSMHKQKTNELQQVEESKGVQGKSGRGGKKKTEQQLLASLC